MKNQFFLNTLAMSESLNGAECSPHSKLPWLNTPEIALRVPRHLSQNGFLSRNYSYFGRLLADGALTEIYPKPLLSRWLRLNCNRSKPKARPCIIEHRIICIEEPIPINRKWHVRASLNSSVTRLRIA